RCPCWWCSGAVVRCSAARDRGRAQRYSAPPGRTSTMAAAVGSDATTVHGEGARGDGPRAQPEARRGLHLTRLYTTEGVHPYEEVTWERRDVVMTNWRDGSVNFEQLGVEFPEFWSANATNIVTSKYFRGALGTPQRESSLKQLI